jgi:hypothetical protein
MTDIKTLADHVQRNPNDPEGWAKLADALESSGAQDKAEYCRSQAARLTADRDDLPKESNRNPVFMIAMKTFGILFLISAVCVGGFLFGLSGEVVTLPNQGGANATQTAIAAQKFINQALTATFQASILPTGINMFSPTVTLTAPLGQPSSTPPAHPPATRSPTMPVQNTEASTNIPPVSTPSPTSIVPGSDTKFFYIVRVLDIQTNNSISQAIVMIGTSNTTSQTQTTGENGLAAFEFDNDQVGQPATLFIVAEGYNIYTENIDLRTLIVDVFLSMPGFEATATQTPDPGAYIDTPTATIATMTKPPTGTPVTPSPPTPNPTMTIQAAFGEIDTQFKGMLKSNIAFNKPSQMKKDETTSIELILNPSLSKHSLATQVATQVGIVTSPADSSALMAPGSASVTIETSQIEITQRMKAVLSPQNSEAFAIEEMHDDAEQVVSSVETTTWRWSVTAKQEGPQTLELVIYQLVKYDGKEFWHEVETYKTNIVVEVTPLKKVESLDWKWIAGFILTLTGSVLGVSSWVSSRKKKVEKEKPVKDARSKIIIFVKENEFITHRQCRELLGLEHDQAIILLNEMVKNGILIREGKTSPIKYRFAKK